MYRARAICYWARSPPAMGIELASLQVEIEADWDARGTMAMGDYPIGLTAIRSRTRATVPQDVKGERADRLLRSAEKYCVVLNTLRNGVPVASTFSLDQRQSGSRGDANCEA